MVTKYTSIKTFFSFIILFFITVASIDAQSLPSNIDGISNDELQSYWTQAKAQGYTMDQIKAVASSKGVSSDQIAAFEERISSMGASAVGVQGDQIDTNLGVSDSNSFGFTGSEISAPSNDDPLFGYAFFNNQNITFTPNLNLATPRNYELGPGDELVVNVWGAAENTYSLFIDREGALRIPNVGPAFVSGMSLDEATTVIINKLKRVYGGIDAPANSPYKVNISLSLVNARSVQVNIIGEVKVPGTYTLSSLSTVLNALYAAGGPTKEGTFREIKLVRNGEEVSTFDVYQYLINGSQKGNKTVKDQDVIIVSPYESRISISGAVKRPGIYELLDNEDFGDLLKYVSGFKSTAFKDRFILNRIKGDRRILKEITYNNMLSEKLQSGDRLTVNGIIDEYENKITISGAVYRPGDYPYTEGLTIKDLVLKASGLTRTAFQDRGIIYRRNSKIDKFTMQFSLRGAMNGTENFILQPNDEVRVFDADTFQSDYTVSITGSVRNPNSFEYFDGITIQDLILRAGGFTDSANNQKIDIYRFIGDDDFETLSESITVSASGQFDTETNEPYLLKAKDRISVRSLKGYNDQKQVRIEGEVNYPGAYLAEFNGERISSFIKRAGGLSPYAFEQGATLVRINPFYKDDAQELTTEVVNENTASNLALNNKKEFRVGINLSEILGKNGDASKSNLVLKTGDRIIVPSIKETIKTEGELFIPSLIRYEDDWTLKDYIDRSGGFGEKAKKSKTYVVYANGDIRSTKRFLFFKSYPEIEPGAIILVPKKMPKESLFSLKEAISAGTGVTALALLIDRLLDK